METPTVQRCSGAPAKLLAPLSRPVTAAMTEPIAKRVHSRRRNYRYEDLSMLKCPLSTFVFVVALCTASASAGQLQFNDLGAFDLGPNQAAGGLAEIVAHDPGRQQIYAINGTSGKVEILQLPAIAGGALIKVGELDTSNGGATSPNSVAVRGGLIAVALQNQLDKTQPGSVAFYNTDGLLLSSVAVGALPDMLTFTPDGLRVLVANEGEPGSVDDPKGTVSIINLNLVGGVPAPTVVTLDFTAFDAAPPTGVRLFPGRLLSDDVEPEYIAISPDGSKAYVTLQEANTVAVIDIATGTVDALNPLGFKDHALLGNGLDPSDRDGGIHIGNWPVRGLFMPDGIAAYTAGNGDLYTITVNEGDDRAENRLLSGLVLDPTIFPPGSPLRAAAALGRLNLSPIDGDTDGDGDIDQLYSYGARSFTIWDSGGALVWDSGDFIEQFIANEHPAFFNVSHGDNTLDSRSDNKGPEPEGVVVGRVMDTVLAFIGLERDSGVLVFDVTDAAAPQFLDYLSARDFSQSTASPLAGDLGPEGLNFVSAANSPYGRALLLVGNEVSGTVRVYGITSVPAPPTLSLALAALLGCLAVSVLQRGARRRKVAG